MTRHLVPALAGALLLSGSAFAAPAAPPPGAEPHPALALVPNGKLMLVKGPAHVDQIVSAGTGTAQVFEVATPNATNAGCVANPVPGTATLTVANASTQEVKRQIPAGHLLCANLTAGTTMSLTWYGHQAADPKDGITITATAPKFLVAGPTTVTHIATGGDGQVSVYTMNANTASDADCLPAAPPPAAGAKPAAPPPAAAPGTLPVGGVLLKKLGLRASEKENLVVPAGKVACGLVTGGSEGKVVWQAK